MGTVSPGWVITRNALQTLGAGVHRTWVPGLPALLNRSQRQPLPMLPPARLSSCLLSPPRPRPLPPTSPPARVLILGFPAARGAISLSGTCAALRKPAFLGRWFLTWLPVASLGSFYSFLPRVGRPPLCGAGERPTCFSAQPRPAQGLSDAWGPRGPLLSREAGVWDLEHVSRGGRCRVGPMPAAELGQQGRKALPGTGSWAKPLTCGPQPVTAWRYGGHLSGQSR